MKGPIFNLEQEEFKEIFNRFTMGLKVCENEDLYVTPNSKESITAVDYFDEKNHYDPKFKKSIRNIRNFIVAGVHYIIIYQNFSDPMGGVGYRHCMSICKDPTVDLIYLSFPIKAVQSSTEVQERIIIGTIKSLFGIHLNIEVEKLSSADKAFLNALYDLFGYLTGFIDGDFYNRVNSYRNLQDSYKSQLAKRYIKMKGMFVRDHLLSLTGKEIYIKNKLITPQFFDYVTNWM